MISLPFIKPFQELKQWYSFPVLSTTWFLPFPCSLFRTLLNERFMQVSFWPSFLPLNTVACVLFFTHKTEGSFPSVLAPSFWWWLSEILGSIFLIPSSQKCSLIPSMYPARGFLRFRISQTWRFLSLFSLHYEANEYPSFLFEHGRSKTVSLA